MRIRLVHLFTKITAWPVQRLCFRTKIYYEDRAAQGRRIRGSAIVVSNHTTIYDYAVYLFVFFGRTLRAQMAEVLFKKRILGRYLKCMGGIRVDRNIHDMGFMAESERILKQGGAVMIFPEGRLPRKEETELLPFKTGAAFLALSTGVPVIPVYTNGSYFCRKCACVLIGKPMLLSEYVGASTDPRENISAANRALRARIAALGELLDERTKES